MIVIISVIVCAIVVTPTHTSAASPNDAPLPINVWRTHRDNGDRLHPQPAIKWAVDNGSLPVDHSLVQVLSFDRFQTILGFGGGNARIHIYNHTQQHPAHSSPLMIDVRPLACV
jgi:hypothetical protein